MGSKPAVVKQSELFFGQDLGQKNDSTGLPVAPYVLLVRKPANALPLKGKKEHQSLRGSTPELAKLGGIDAIVQSTEGSAMDGLRFCLVL